MKAKQAIKIFFKDWKTFEIIYLATAITTTTILSIVFKGGVLETTASLLMIVYCLLAAKGKVLSQVFAILSSIFYIIVSYKVGLYGEVWKTGLITIPISIIAFFTWIMNMRKTEKEAQVIKIRTITKLELWIFLGSQVLMSIGYYYVFKALHTQMLIGSTIAFTITIIASYFMIRRSELNYYAWIANSVVSIVLWAVLSSTNIAILPLVIMSCFLIINDTYGVINWYRLKKEQKSDV